MGLLGVDGLRQVAAASHDNAQTLIEKMRTVPGVKLLFDSPRFHETVLQLPKPAAAVLAKMEAQGVLGGYDLGAHYPQLGNAILVCATETKTATDLQRYVDTLQLSLN